MLTNLNLPVFGDSAIVDAAIAVFGPEDDRWSDVQYSYTHRALGVLQTTVNEIRAEIFCDTPRGKAMDCLRLAAWCTRAAKSCARRLT
jgi:hypothetical protein